MQTVIKEYGESILAAVVTVLVTGLIFGGLALIGKLGVITGRIDTALTSEAMASSETALKKHLEIPAANIDMSSQQTVVCVTDKRIRADELVRLTNGRAAGLCISRVYLLAGEDRASIYGDAETTGDQVTDTEGYEVSDQVLDRDGQTLLFQTPGSYRLVVRVIDSSNVVSDYQLFVTAVRRRRI